MYRSIALSIALVAAVAASASEAAGAAGSFKLDYRATPAAITYDVQLIQNRTDATGQRKQEPVLREVRQAFRREVKANPDGTLTIEDTVLGDESFHSEFLDRLNSTEGPETPPRRGALISPRGERISPVPDNELDACLAPVFPTEAITPGHRWKSEVEFPASSGKRLEVQHEFLGVETVHGQPCAIVVSEVEVKDGAVKDAKYACKGHARTGISLTEGALLENQTFFNIVQKGRRPGEDEVRTHHEILRTITRRVDGPAATPSPAR